MSWQQPTPPPTDEPAPTGTDATTTTNPVIVRTAQSMVFLGRLRGDANGPRYGHAVVLRDSRPIYSWPREGLHHVAAYAGDATLAGLRLGPAIHEHWLADVRTVWGLTEDSPRSRPCRTPTPPRLSPT